MVEIELTKGFVALVDDVDAEKVAAFKWHVSKPTRIVYASAYVPRTIKGVYKKMYLHRFIMNCPKGLVVDHINGNGLDNRRENLRVCTHKENCRNKTRRIKTSYKYKGVVLDKRSNTWYARIRHDKQRVLSKAVQTEVEAAHEYNKLAIQYHKEFACLNTIDDI